MMPILSVDPMQCFSSEKKVRLGRRGSTARENREQIPKRHAPTMARRERGLQKRYGKLAAKGRRGRPNLQEEKDGARIMSHKNDKQEKKKRPNNPPKQKERSGKSNP